MTDGSAVTNISWVRPFALQEWWLLEPKKSQQSVSPSRLLSFYCAFGNSHRNAVLDSPTGNCRLSLPTLFQRIGKWPRPAALSFTEFLRRAARVLRRARTLSAG